jgi:hypothetical protein
LEEMRGIWFEEEEAEGAIGECAIAVVCIIPMLEGCEIPMYAADQGIATIVALGKGEKVSDVDQHLLLIRAFRKDWIGGCLE